MKPFIAFLAVTFAVVSALFAGCTQQAAVLDRETMYQVSTFNALSQGVYDGSESFRELKNHGDTGIGTLNALDGELIVVDGQPYQMKADGSVVPVNEDGTTPFAIVTYFDSDLTGRVTDLTGLPQLMASVNASMANKNVMYAIKSHGHFDHVRVRSVPAQPKPYPVLAEAVKGQAVFDLDDVDGTIVGVWFPDYMAGVNVAGFHFHFIADDHTKGGHLLDCSAGELAYAIDETGNFSMALPGDDAFGRADIGKTNETAIGIIER